MSTETQSEFWTEQYLGVPLRAQGAVDLVNELRDKHWTTDEWRMFLQLLGEDPDQAGLLEEHFNEGYEVGEEDGEKAGHESGYDDGHTDGVMEAERESEDEIEDLQEIVTLALPYVEEETKLPNYKPGAGARLLTRMRKAIK